jgi:cytochrome c2
MCVTKLRPTWAIGPAGKVDGSRYSAGFANADFPWDDARLERWLANPEAIIPGAIIQRAGRFG